MSVCPVVRLVLLLSVLIIDDVELLLTGFGCNGELINNRIEINFEKKTNSLGNVKLSGICNASAQRLGNQSETLDSPFSKNDKKY